MPHPRRTSEAQAVATPDPLLSDISIAIVGILREHDGDGPTMAKTYALDDIVVVVTRGSRFTPLEQTTVDSGHPEGVIQMRDDFQRMMADRYKETIEEVTGRRVAAFPSHAHVEPDVTMQVFFMDKPLDHYGALEVVQPAQPLPSDRRLGTS
jgi:uncharacterized protein YbcI